MGDSRILNPDGLPVQRTEFKTSGDIAISTNFSMESGRGTVKFRIPITAEAAELVAKLKILITEGRDVGVSADTLLDQLGRMLPEGGAAYQMFPAEARILGMQFMAQAEEAMSNAIFLRAAMEIFHVEPQMAVQLLRTLGQATRQDHALVYEKQLAEAERLSKMEASNGSGEAH